DAEKELVACVQDAPGLSDPWLVLARLKAAQGDSTEVISILERGIEANPSDTDLYLELAGRYEETGEFQKVERLYKIIDDLDSTIGDTYEQLSKNYMNALEQPTAQQFANLAAKLNKKHVRNQLFLSSYLAVVDTQTCYGAIVHGMKVAMNPGSVSSNYSRIPAKNDDCESDMFQGTFTLMR
ncbi:MAG: tetratricopeptide repeat protein, partial [Gammaproteobacteria bacterium]|nr:tetratricopeptide repeat protein [Gammaproteobacteria bacterium]